MTSEILKVADFHNTFRIPVNYEPTIPAPERIQLRHDILQEEVNELKKAMEDGNMVEVADGIVDCLYILFGTALECGLAAKLPALFNEVHRSNMSKLDENGRPVFREDGKVIKSNLYTPPQLEPIIYQK